MRQICSGQPNNKTVLRHFEKKPTRPYRIIFRYFIYFDTYSSALIEKLQKIPLQGECICAYELYAKVCEQKLGCYEIYIELLQVIPKKVCTLLRCLLSSCFVLIDQQFSEIIPNITFYTILVVDRVG